MGVIERSLSMTNAEKFKEVFGFDIDQECCIADIMDCRSCPLDNCRGYDADCTHGFWQSKYQGEPTIPLSVIEKIHDAIDNAECDARLKDESGSFTEEVFTREHIAEIIDKAVKECTHDKG